MPGGIQSICPRCGTESAGHDVTLGLALGPVAEGTRLFLVESDSKLDEVLDQVRRVMVSAALRRSSGNIARAAKVLGVKYTTLYSIVRRLGLDDPSLQLTRRRGRSEPGMPPGDERPPGEAREAGSGTTPDGGPEPGTDATSADPSPSG